MTDYYYDTYAIIEFARGNEAYLKYFKEPSGVTTRLNLMEVYYAYLQDPDYAEELFASFSSIAIEVTDSQLKRAMVRRKELKDKGLNISYVDAVGYQVARERKMKFLTGDEAFRDLPGVEFVK